jgi:hypothetical protein
MSVPDPKQTPALPRFSVAAKVFNLFSKPYRPGQSLERNEAAAVAKASGELAKLFK